MSTSTSLPPPPPPPPYTTFFNPVVVPNTPYLPPPYISTLSHESPSSSSSSTTTSIIIVIIIISSAVIVSASIYLLLRFLSRRFHRSFRTYSAADDVIISPPPPPHNPNSSSSIQCSNINSTLLDSLPLFTFRDITNNGTSNGNLTGGDCAVCLSKFEPHDHLRLLPLCCHAFHADCIDTWIVSNRTCPLCRSTVLPSDADVLNKIQNLDNIINDGNSFRSGNGSFRIEMGSISRRHGGEAAALPPGSDRRSYSVGSFDYIVDDNGYEVSVGSTVDHRRGGSDVDKDSTAAAAEIVAAEVSTGGRSWLREYMDRLGSVSFRSSGRYFTGSSRRSEMVIEDLEANRVGEEISELFRWLSGV